MTQPTHIKPGLDALLRKLEVKRNAWKTEQEMDQWIIDRANDMNDWYLEVFNDVQNCTQEVRHGNK